MKTVEQIVDAISMHGCRSDWVDALHQYGEQVAERVTERDCVAICAYCEGNYPYTQTGMHSFRGTYQECLALAIRAAQRKEREG
jgi:hypothetical protein